MALAFAIVASVMLPLLYILRLVQRSRSLELTGCGTLDAASRILSGVDRIGGVLANAADRVAARRESEDGKNEGRAGCQFFRHHDGLPSVCDE